jgi:hypothetical protein
MDLRPITLGDGRRTARGWLVVSRGAVRAVLTPADRKMWLHFACDRRVRPADGYRTFGDVEEARSWLEGRLEPGTPRDSPGDKDT